ncbi:MAG: transposase [Candidatus Cloacimonadales bacterium]|nr:transposase [Candidatus Cloacimonadales bacterium]
MIEKTEKLRKKKEERKKKRKSPVRGTTPAGGGVLSGEKKFYYQFIESGPNVEQMLNIPMMMLFLQHGKVKELIEELAMALPQSGSNNYRSNLEMLRLTLFMIMGGYGSPEDFNAKVAETEREHYRINIGVSTFYDWLERIKGYEKILSKFVEKTAKLFLTWRTCPPYYSGRRKGSGSKMVVDIDASYRESKILWCRRNYKGDHSFRLLFTHVSSEKTGAKAILKVDVDPGNVNPATGIAETLKQINMRHDIGLFRSDSAAYNTNVTNYLDLHGIDWMIGADLDSAVLDTIGCITNYEPYYKEDVKTDDMVGSTGHAMNKSGEGFMILNKRVPLASISRQVSFFEILGEKYKNISIAVSSGYMKEKSLSEIRHDYECRGGQESMIANFKQFYDVKAKESLEKTKVWINLLAIGYNLSLYFLRKDAQKKNREAAGYFRTAVTSLCGRIIKTGRKIIVKLWGSHEMLKIAKRMVGKELVLKC